MSTNADMSGLLERGMPFAARTGIKVLKLDRENIELLMPLTPNINHIGIMYAGALFTLGEMMGGAVALVYLFEHSLIPIVKSFSIKFVKPGTTDITTS
ncbi:MAG: DUF4442 domain-containing protein, partial [Desulfobacteraceae bacterium]